MFQWYRKSGVCYAYMSDVEKECANSPFRYSRCFTRGWTLQELITPLLVLFFDRNWQLINSRHDLRHDIHKATGLPHKILLRTRTVEIGDYSIARRMAWASRRQTTRIEGEAYCLLGFFDVNMPLLYGEGPKAFARLQVEIARVSNDHSLFSWRGTTSFPSPPPSPPLESLLAPSPT